MADKSLTEEELRRIHWCQLYLSLPPEGVSKRYVTDEAAEMRFAEVRWPGGTTCRKCSSQDVIRDVVRKNSVAENADTSSPVKTGSCLHNSNLSIRKWFLAAEYIVDCHARGRTADLLTSHRLKDRVKLSYKVAHAGREVLEKSLVMTEQGLISRSICLQTIATPPDLVLSSREHLLWLLERTAVQAI
jgi:hypothetical protein